MPSAVVDASTLVDLLIGGPSSGAIFELLFRQYSALHAPYSIDLDVSHAIRRLWRRGLLVDRDVENLGAIYPRIRIERHSMSPVLHRIWRFGYDITPHDGAYIALAEWLDLPLITRDSALAHTRGHAARIEYIG